MTRYFTSCTAPSRAPCPGFLRGRSNLLVGIVLGAILASSPKLARAEFLRGSDFCSRFLTRATLAFKDFVETYRSLLPIVLESRQGIALLQRIAREKKPFDLPSSTGSELQAVEDAFTAFRIYSETLDSEGDFERRALVALQEFLEQVEKARNEAEPDRQEVEVVKSSLEVRSVIPGSGSSIVFESESMESGSYPAALSSPNGQYLATRSSSPGLKLYAADTGALLLDTQDVPVVGMAFSPDSQKLVYGTEDGRVRVFDVFSKIQTFEDETLLSHPLRYFTFTPDGIIVGTAELGRDSRSYKTLLWDLSASEPKRVKLNARGRTAGFLPRTRRLLFKSYAGLQTLKLPARRVRITSDSQLPEAETVYSERQAPFASSRDGRYLKVAIADISNKWQVVAFDVRGTSSRKALDIDGIQCGLSNYSFAMDLMAGIHQDGTIRLWNLLNGERTQPLFEPNFPWASLASIQLSPDAKFLAIGFRGGRIEIWGVEERKRVASKRLGVGDLGFIEWSDSGRRVFAHSAGFSQQGRITTLDFDPNILEE